jgi:hypothetical protein
VDGRLGRSTTKAIRAFQACFPVKDDLPGVAGEATKSALAVAQSTLWSREECAS